MLRSYLLVEDSCDIIHISCEKACNLHYVSWMLEMLIVIFLTSLHMTSLSDLEFG